MLLNRLMKSKYHQDCSTWLCSLTMEQLDLVSSLLFTCNTLQELKISLLFTNNTYKVHNKTVSNSGSFLLQRCMQQETSNTIVFINRS